VPKPSQETIQEMHQAIQETTNLIRGQTNIYLGQHVIIPGSNGKALATQVASHLKFPKIVDTHISRFNDGEIRIQIQETIRGKHVYIIQSIGSSATSGSVNDALVETLLLVDTARKSSASKITLVLPYYGYARQDRKTRSREPISASVIARLLETVAPDRIVTIDLHCGQIQGFFHNTTIDHLHAEGIFADWIKDTFISPSSDLVIVSPDAGGVERAGAIQRRTGISAMATIIKRRANAGTLDSMQLVGDVAGKAAIIIDDMIDTAGTLCKAAELLMQSGATDVYACATHGLFSGPAFKRIEASCLRRVVVTNTLERDGKHQDKIKVLDIAPLIGKALSCIIEKKSVSSLFQ